VFQLSAAASRIVQASALGGTTTRSHLYWNTLLRIPTQLVAFALSLVVTRLLMPEDYGVMGVAMMLIGFANLFTDFGLGGAIIQKQIRDAATLQSIFTFNFGSSAVLALAFSFSSGLIADFFRSPACHNVVIVMSSLFVITAFSAVPRALLMRDGDFKTLSLIDAASAISSGALTLLLAALRYGYWALALGHLIPAAVFSAYLCLRVGWRPRFAYRHSSMKQVFDFGMWNVLKTQLEFAVGHADRLLLGRLAGLEALGYYDKGLSIAAVPTNSFLASLNAVLFASFSQRKKDQEDVRRLFEKGLMTVSLLSFPLYAGLAVVAGHFVVGLFGAKWSPMVLPFRILALAFIVKSLLGLLVAVNVAIGQYRAYTIRFSVASGAFVVLCLSLVSYGPSGVAGAFFVFGALSVLLGLHLAVSTLDLSWTRVWRACWPATKATLLMVALTTLLARLRPAETLGNLIGVSLAGAAVYTLSLAFEKNRAFVELRTAALSDISSLRRRSAGSARVS